MAVRKALDFIFSQSELYWLDHLLPEEERRKKEDEEKHKVGHYNTHSNFNLFT
jgi:sodium bicarbonate cotransporter 4